MKAIEVVELLVVDEPEKPAMLRAGRMTGAGAGEELELLLATTSEEEEEEEEEEEDELELELELESLFDASDEEEALPMPAGDAVVGDLTATLHAHKESTKAACVTLRKIF